MKGDVRADCVKMISNIIDMKDRNQHIINIINELRKDPERKILILSDRKAHLKFLKESVDVYLEQDIKDNKILKDECKTYYYTGDLKQAERIDAEKNADILFATFNMAHEGLDIDRLNSIILATPKKDVVQAVGRIMRKILQDGDIRPLIIDIVDNFSIFPGQFKKREIFYKKSEYIIDNHYIYNDKIISPKEFFKLSGNDSKIPSSKHSENYFEMLQVPPVEIIKDECDDKKAGDDTKNCVKKKEKSVKKEITDDIVVTDEKPIKRGLGMSIFGKK
jgi:superfamily II DNA or RNA helicase